MVDAMTQIRSLSEKSLRLLNFAIIGYAICGTIFLVAFIFRFHDRQISIDPTDWIGMSGMLGGLLGPPLALWSIGLVLRSLQLQQEQVAKQQKQYDEMLERENLRLDPTVVRVELAAAPSWAQGSFGGMTFNLIVKGDVEWHYSTTPNGPNPAAIKNVDGTIEVVLWKKQESEKNYRGFLNYRRANGSEGWHWISIGVDEKNGSSLGFITYVASAPVESEDGLRIELVDPITARPSHSEE
jgi:hypothetical protein